MEKVNNISREEVSVIPLMLNATQCQIVSMRGTHTKTLNDLQTQVKTTEELECNKNCMSCMIVLLRQLKSIEY